MMKFLATARRRGPDYYIGWLGSRRVAVVYRWLLVVCTAATLLVTWSLWQVRTAPPMLPLLPLPCVDMGIPLLLALGVILFKPRLGMTAFTVLLVYAMLCDQIRIQPQFISFTFLLWATLPNPDAQFIGRVYLISLWVWAGINKLLSPAFINSTGPGLMTSLLPESPLWLRSNGGTLIALAEFSIGLLAIFPKTRLVSALLAFGVHMNIVLILSPLRRNWNESVWAWNLALAFAGLVLIVPWKDRFLPTFRRTHRLTRLAAVVLLVMPLGFYFGVVDAYMAHNLYSSNVPRSNRTPPTWLLFNVPFPPEHRLFEQYFHLTCHDGDTMQIRDRRWWFQQRGMALRTIDCEAHDPDT